MFSHLLLKVLGRSLTMASWYRLSIKKAHVENKGALTVELWDVCVCACMPICVYVCGTCMSVWKLCMHLYLCMYSCAHECVCVPVYIHICMSVYSYMYSRASIHACIDVYMAVHISVYMYVCMCLCMCCESSYLCMCIHMSVYAYMC